MGSWAPVVPQKSTEQNRRLHTHRITAFKATRGVQWVTSRRGHAVGCEIRAVVLRVRIDLFRSPIFHREMLDSRSSVFTLHFYSYFRQYLFSFRYMRLND